MTGEDYKDVAIVTGAAGGLGQVIARRLAGEGLRVLITDIDGDAADRVAQNIPGQVIAQALDVRDPAQFENAFAVAHARWGGVGLLVNNAALTCTTPLFEISTEEFDAVISVALKGCFVGCQVAGRRMRAQHYGRIINIASLAGQNGGSATGAHYAAAKGGILTLTKVFARALAPDGVTVNAISPGPLDLDSVRQLVKPDQLETIIETIPARTLGDPDYVARFVSLLASPQAVSAIGATFDINGGLYLR
ncbi:MAG: SDR family oxidoreductase [Sphingorhabdus sp.]